METIKNILQRCGDTLRDWREIMSMKNAWTLLLAVALVAVIGVKAFGEELAQARPAFRICTGGDSGNYFAAGNILRQQATNVDVQVQTSRGSMENLERILAGECDGGYVQTDAYRVFGARNPRIIPAVERAGTIYEEYVHFLCNRNAGITRITQLTNRHTVAVGPEGSGSAVTWQGFVIADQRRYGPVNIDPRATLRALAAVADGTQVQCMIYVGALRSSFMMNDAKALADRIILVAADDSDFDNQRDQRGNRVYNFREIPRNLYGNLQPSGFVNYTAVRTVAMEAVFVVSTAWIERNERAYDGLLRASAATRTAMQARISGR